MSTRWFYEIDGQIIGPVEQTRLRLLADSGMLQPHHRVRKENEPWHQANAVKGLFSPSVPLVGVPVMGQVPHAEIPAVPAPDAGFAEWGPREEEAEAPPGVFDFFSDNDPAPAPFKAPPPEKAAPARSRKTEARSKPRSDAVSPPASHPEKSRPEPTPPHHEPAFIAPVPTPVAEMEIPEVVEEVVEEGANPFAFEPMPAAGIGAEPRLAETRLSVTPKPTVNPPENVVPEPVHPTASEAPAAVSPSPTSTTGSKPGVPVPEIAGRPVELLPEYLARMSDGRTVMRLHRAWLQITTKYSDGTYRQTYLRVHQIDAAIIERRYEAGPVKKGPHSILTFRAGELVESIAFEGNEKPIRMFVEKVLSLASGVRLLTTKES